MSDDDNNNRVMPTSDLDLQAMLTDSVWGRPEISQELKDKLKVMYQQNNPDGTAELDNDGQPITVEKSLWGLLNFYTRDMRLGNLSMMDGTFQYVTHYIDLAHDLLVADMVEPFLIALSRAATQLEVSQSKGGFLRKINNTLRKEEYTGTLEPPKKAMFGGNKREGQI